MSNRIEKPSAVGVAAALMIAAGSAGAVGLPDVTTNGVNIAYFSLNPGAPDRTLGKSTTDPGQQDRDDIVQGENSPCVSNADPGAGGNIELGDVDADVWTNASTLEGELGSFGTIELSGLTLVDWNTVVAPGVTLAAQYIKRRH